MRAITTLTFFFALLAGAARAESEAPAADAGRFVMTPAPNGFLRLDKETGAVAHCSVEDGLSVCRAAAEERAALEAEIERLSRENAELRAKLAGSEAPKKALPGEQELERALSFTEKFMRRMMKLFREETPEGERL